MAKILAPNKQYDGVTATVQFKEGVGETSNPHLIEWFRSRGYQVIEDEKPVEQLEQNVELVEDPEVEKPTRGRKNKG